MEKPKCPVCHGKHWAGEPHVWKVVLAEAVAPWVAATAGRVVVPAKVSVEVAPGPPLEEPPAEQQIVKPKARRVKLVQRVDAGLMTKDQLVAALDDRRAKKALYQRRWREKVKLNWIR